MKQLRTQNFMILIFSNIGRGAPEQTCGGFSCFGYSFSVTEFQVELYTHMEYWSSPNDLLSNLDDAE